MTQLEYAKNNIITPLMRKVAQLEGLAPKELMRLIRLGQVVIPLNINHKIKKPCAVGRSLSTKVNANIGTSTDESRIADEIQKLKTAIKYGADALMDVQYGEDRSNDLILCGKLVATRRNASAVAKTIVFTSVEKIAPAEPKTTQQ